MGKEREIKRERQAQRERKRDRERQRKRARETERETERERKTDNNLPKLGVHHSCGVSVWPHLAGTHWVVDRERSLLDHTGPVLAGIELVVLAIF